MPLVEEIEKQLPLVAELPEDWQKDIALILSKFVVAYDNTLIMTPEEQRALRDREIDEFQQRLKLRGLDDTNKN